MGRIKTTLIKRTAKKLFTIHKTKFTGNFAQDKVAVAELADVPSKKMKNVIAGYITRLVKQEEAK
ncbi:MAG: 30S ribosomal protein S17e [Candidatus Nanoarchaeia archaeon]|nr:30S ribosomal protein S17e [Candidatus Nanoarchaeia archaeon]